MFVRTIFFGVVFLASIQFCIGQSVRKHGLSRQMTFSTDNDFFLLTDRYYTFGMDIEFNSLIKPSSKLFKKIAQGSDSSKIRWNYHYGNKIFTPSDIDTWQTKYMDRPYAGWNFLRAGMTIYNKRNVGHDFGVEVGLVGEISGMGQFQEWWHELINIYPVRGWESQIADEVVVNLHYSHTRNWTLVHWVDLVSISKIALGTGLNNLGQEFNFRFLKFNTVNNSAFTGSRISWNKKERPYGANSEAFFFLGLGGEYVASNIFIEGSLFEGNRSVYTLEARKLVFLGKAGFTYSRQVLDYSLTWYHIGYEINNTYRGNYLSLALSVRF